MSGSVTAGRIARLALPNTLEHGLNGAFRVGFACEQIAGEMGILQIEEGFKSRDLWRSRVSSVSSQPALEQYIELFHAAPTTPT